MDIYFEGVKIDFKKCFYCKNILEVNEKKLCEKCNDTKNLQLSKNVSETVPIYE
jgi:hypothetical protein